jgi:quercetin dioxygenase-like cupin family protein
MRYLRLYSDAEGVSHFDPVEVEFAQADYAPPAPPIWTSTPQAAVRAFFYSIPPGWSGDWHPSPTRQFYVQVRGAIEFGAGDGERRRIEPGMVVLLEDVVPPGHISRAVGDEDSIGFLVPLEGSPPADVR